MDGGEPWDRQPSETSRAYTLFAHYRDVGPLERSLRRVARDTERSLGSLEQLSRRNSWLARAEAWDADNDRHRRALQARERDQMARRQVLTGQLLASKALRRAQAMSDDEVAHLSVGEMMRMVEGGFRLERLGRGAPGDLDTPCVLHEDAALSTADTPIIEIVRHDPNRVGPVMEILAKLQDLLPELGPAGRRAEVDDEELADLRGMPEAADDT